MSGMIPEKNDKNKLVFYYHLVGGTRINSILNRLPKFGIGNKLLA